MPTISDKDRTPKVSTAKTVGSNLSGSCDVLLCVSEPRVSVQTIPHAQAVAEAFGGQVVLLHVVEPPANGTTPVDPVDWDIRRREMAKQLNCLARKFETPLRKIDVQILDGQCVEQTSAYVADRPHDIVAASRQSSTARWHLGELTRGVMASDRASILMIPANAPKLQEQSYTKVFVPLDGSARAESALPKAARLANAAQADLVLCNVTPPPGLTTTGVMDREVIDLMEKVTLRNKRVGQKYLTRIQNNMSDCGVPVSTRVVVGDDVRRSLIKAISEEGADFIVMASHGQSGHMDVPAGDVASFILEQSAIPVLMVRQPIKPRDEHVFVDVVSEGARLPAQSKK